MNGEGDEGGVGRERRRLVERRGRELGKGDVVARKSTLCNLYAICTRQLLSSDIIW